MSVFRESHTEDWQLHNMILSVRAMFDALRKYSIEVEEQNDQQLSHDTVMGICEAGYDLADRAYTEALKQNVEALRARED